MIKTIIHLKSRNSEERLCNSIFDKSSTEREKVNCKDCVALMQVLDLLSEKVIEKLEEKLW